MLTLTLRAPPAVPLELDGVTPDRLHALSTADVARLPVQHGNRAEPLGAFFDVTGSPADGELAIRGDVGKVKLIGAGMTAGRLVADAAGMHAGAGMTGGELRIDGDAGDWLAAEMRGGTVTVRGRAGDQVGAAYRGSRRGMTGGAIHVFGSAGVETGLLMRRGLIAVGGACGAFAGASMIAGSLFVFGPLGDRAGAGMKRGTILAAGGVGELPPSFRHACDYTPTFLALYLRSLAAAGFPAVAVPPAGVRCYRGDVLYGGRGEVLVIPSNGGVA